MAAYTNAKPHTPEVFKQVMLNDREREAIRDELSQRTGTGEYAVWHRLRELVQDRKNLRVSAEAALRWNTDKGAAG